jgi:hypothetical protein
MNSRRESGIDVNFDSLTDVVTNLVGGLILLIIVVIGATTPRISGVRTLPPPDNKAGAEHPIDQLLDRIRAMQDEVQLIEQDIVQVEDELPQLAMELEDLKKK